MFQAQSHDAGKILPYRHSLRQNFKAASWTLTVNGVSFISTENLYLHCHISRWTVEYKLGFSYWQPKEVIYLDLLAAYTKNILYLININ